MAQARARAGVLLIACGALCALLGALALAGAPAPAAAQELPARPTVQPPRADDGGDEAQASGRIAGTVIDLTSGAPTPGVTVAVGERRLTTDANGNYDVSGLPAGDYLVALVLAPGAGEPAQAAVTVSLPEGGFVVQHLAFRSPVKTPREAAPAAAPLPAALPRTGGSDGGWALALGLALVAAGGALRRRR